MIDIHAHLCLPEFDKDLQQVVDRARDEIDGIIVSSARLEEGKKVLELVKKNPGFLFATLGYHPTEGTGPQGVLKLIDQNHDKIVGIGETGLDYHWESDLKKRDLQKLIFGMFISAAEKYRLPIVIHSWDAEPDCFSMVRDTKLKCVFHCFSGEPELAKQIVDRGFFVSLSTNICFSKNLRKIARVVPLESMLLETDSPFLDPERKRNVPWNIKISAEKIAAEKGVTKERVLISAKENAVRVFNLEQIEVY